MGGRNGSKPRPDNVNLPPAVYRGSQSLSGLIPCRAAPPYPFEQLNPLVITLLGPTASGKTALALEIAERLDLPVINVDSRQLYREMDLGTAKPTAEQQARVPHHLLDLRTPDQPITLQEFQAEALPCIDAVLHQHGKALLVGGSGLYLKALTSGLQPPAVAPQPQLRQQLTALGQNILPTAAGRRPQGRCQNRSGRCDAHPARFGSALCLRATDEPPGHSHPSPLAGAGTGLNPANLRQRIQQRTEQLYRDGLVEETRRLSERYGADLPLLQTIGYGEACR